MKPSAALMSALLFSALTSAARADLIWYEQVNGDFSDDRLNPTPLTLAEGSNDIFGRMDGIDGSGHIDRDYFRITVPAGLRLTAIILDSYVSTDAAAFLAIHPGLTFPFDPDTVQAEDPLGWVLFGTNQIDADLLALMSTNGQRFTPPLPEGIYTLWAQQIGDLTEYAMNFVVEPVPAPVAGLALAALAAAGRRRR